jgi:hypothetical protein
MGVCKLPAKEDYFPNKQSDVLPQHPAIHLSKSMLDYLWRNFHVSFATNDEEFFLCNDHLCSLHFKQFHGKEGS